MTAARDHLNTALADRYRIERELGAGGMATVYVAEDLRHRRKVAVKVFRPDLAAALGGERFLREIETTAGLRHPHILPLYDSGEAAGLLFYVMPLVEGESLRQRLTREKQLPLDDALQIARELSDALSYAHTRGVIHRDIKPENILLEGGHAMLADFGIARAVSAVGADALTETGTTVGTPTYMSPEQAAGEQDLDGRSDLYSLACVVYEMLAGQPPFTGSTVESLIRQHIAAEPRPISQIRPTVPPAVEAALLRALHKNPADRFSPVAQFADALQSRVAPAGRPAAAARPRAARWAAVLVAGLLVAIGAMIALTRDTTAPVSDTGPSVAVLPFADLSGGANEYLADGMAETLINALSSVSGLRVAARTSAFSFKGRNEDVRTIGQALGVSAVLEGSVQRAGDRLRITAQLINVRDGFHVWSQSFDRGMADVFAVQDEVARAVVAALEVKLVDAAAGRPAELGTRNLDAYHAYLQGLFFWNKRTTADLQRAATFFQQAIAADSAFARAWAGLAAAYVLFTPSEYNVPGISRREALERAERAARRALTLNERSAEAYTALANSLDQRGALPQAAEAFERAIAIDPRYPTAHQWYASTLVKLGRPAEALEHMQTAQQLDPLSLVIGVETAEYLDLMGRHADATAQYDRMLERYPNTYLTNFYAGLHFLAHRNFERAAPLLAGLATNLGADTVVSRRLVTSLRDSAARTATLTTLTARSAMSGLAALTAIPEVRIAASRALGDDDGAMVAFEQGVDGPAYVRVYLAHARALLGPELSDTPRVQAAIQRLLGRLRAGG